MTEPTIAALQRLKRRFEREETALRTQVNAEELARMFPEATSTARAMRQWGAAISMVDAELRKAKR